MKKAIINLATGHYIKGQARLRQSLQQFAPEVDFFGYTSEMQIGAPPHKFDPYAFKCWAFQKAFDEGYRYVLWVDASVWAIRPVKPVFDHIEKHGYIMQEAGHNCGQWANDTCLSYFEVTRDDAMNLPMYGNAGFLGLDAEDELAMAFFETWFESAKDGIFRGQWHNADKTESQDPRCTGHRHDMVCGSLIANDLGMEFQNGADWLNYAAPADPTGETVIFKAQGIA